MVADVNREIVTARNHHQIILTADLGTQLPDERKFSSLSSSASSRMLDLLQLQIQQSLHLLVWQALRGKTKRQSLD